MLYELLTGNTSTFEQVDRTIAGPGRHYRAVSLLADGGRLLQTHEPWRREYRKAIYLVRDVRDVVCSEFQFCLRLQVFSDDFDAFIDKFVAGRVNRYGSWADHVDSWLNFSNHTQQIFVIKFEELRSQPHTVLEQLLSWLQIERDATEIDHVINRHTISQMQKKEDQSLQFQHNAQNLRFVTDGVVGKGQRTLTTVQLDSLLDNTASLLRSLGYLV